MQTLMEMLQAGERPAAPQPLVILKPMLVDSTLNAFQAPCLSSSLTDKAVYLEMLTAVFCKPLQANYAAIVCMPV